MIRRSTWIVLVVFLGLVGFSIWWTRAKPIQEESEIPPTAEAVWQVLEADVAGLRVEDLEERRALEVRRDPNSLWVLVEPQSGIADASRIERVITWLASPRPSFSIPEAEDLAPYGLDQPRVRVILLMKDGNTRYFNVGKDVPTGNSVYVQFAGRAGAFLLDKFGMDDVLNLLVDLPLVTPTLPPTAAATAIASETPTPFFSPAISPTP